MQTTLEISADRDQALPIARALMGKRLPKAGNWDYADSLVTAHISSIETSFGSRVHITLTSNALTTEDRLFQHLGIALRYYDDENYKDKIVFYTGLYEADHATPTSRSPKAELSLTTRGTLGVDGIGVRAPGFSEAEEHEEVERIGA